MQSNFSISISEKEFLIKTYFLSKKIETDFYLSGKGYKEKNHIIGIEVKDEFIIKKDTKKEDIKKFCFKDDLITLGYLSYNYGLIINKINSNKYSDFPLGHIKKYNGYLLYNINKKILKCISVSKKIYNEIHFVFNNKLFKDFSDSVFCKDCSNYFFNRDSLNNFYEIDFKDKYFNYNVEDKKTLKNQCSMLSKEYQNKVKDVISYIKGGYTYQLNLSIKFERPFKKESTIDELFLYFNKYPAPFYVYYNSGVYKIISTSPERFLRVKNGRILSQPIKGTLKFEKYSKKLDGFLRNNKKEDAELSMIVDLIRNDISYNSEYGSVKVKKHKSIMKINNILQMYSNVVGNMRNDRDCIDLLIDAFPGGSVTGFPKKKTLEIIDELEPHTRDIYCGSFFVIYDEKNMDSSIAIRTGYFDMKNKKFNFYSGSGITIESKPKKEYLETLAKINHFFYEN